MTRSRYAKPERRWTSMAVDDSPKRCEYKMERINEIFTVKYSVVRSAMVKMAHGVLNRPVVKLTPVFFDAVPDIKSRCWRNFKSKKELSHSEKEFWNWKKLRDCQNSKTVKTENFYKFGPKICTPTTPRILDRENLRSPRLWHKIRDISKLFLDLTNDIA